MKYINKDLAQKFASFVYQQEALECPVCETCEVCEKVAFDGECPVVEAQECVIETGVVNVADSVNFDKEFDGLRDKLDEIADLIDKTDRSVDEYDVVDAPVIEKKEPTVQELLERIEELEKNK